MSRPSGPSQASPAPAQGSYPAPAALVCICIDPVYDFMSPDGAFAAGLGVDDTEPVRAVGSRLSDVILSCKQYGYAGHVLAAWVPALLSRCNNFRRAKVVLVRSAYKEGQFSIKSLCTGPTGRALCLPHVTDVGTPFATSPRSLRNMTCIPRRLTSTTLSSSKPTRCSIAGASSAVVSWTW